MNVQTGVVGAPPPADPPGSAGPPGDPPDGFGEVLGARLQKLDGPSTQASTRTARAEGAREESGTDDRAAADAAVGPTADEAVPGAQAEVEPVSEPAVAQVEPEAPQPLSVPTDGAALEDRQAGAKALATLAAVEEPVQATVAAQAVAEDPGATDPVTTQHLAVKPSAVPMPAEPTHPVGLDQDAALATVQQVVAAGDPKEQAAAVTRDVSRVTQHVPAIAGRGEQVPVQPSTPGRVDARPEAAQSALGLAESRRGDTAGGQTGSSPDGGQPGRQGATQVPSTTPVGQQATPTEAAVAAKAEAPLRARARLGELADVAQTLIRVAAKDGKTTARITLRPVELGEVEIRLRYHAGGVSADVVAESRQAAQLLTSASAELKRSLESQGLTVHWLDVRAGADERRGWEELGQPGGKRRDADADAGETEQVTTIEASSLPLAAGAVDVLA